MRTKTGIVVSNKMDKTIVVEITYSLQHPIYKKAYQKKAKFYVDDPQNKYNEGDEVTIYETTPISKTKRWTVEAPKEEAAKQ